jgi:Flp pilus assembly protein TadB
MNRDQLLVAAASATLIVGVTLAASANVPRHGPDRRRRPAPVAALAGLISGALVFAVSGWIVPSLVVGGIAWYLATQLRGARRIDTSSTERVDALASWVENVRDVLQAGNQPVGAIGAATETCPTIIRPQVRSLHARLSAGQSPDVAFRRFADEMDDPLADLVAVGLLIAVSRGSETEDVLSALAAQSRHQADRRRVVEAERAPMQREVLVVSVVMCALLVGVFAFARSDYLSAYDTAEGQLFLAVVLGGYAGMLVWVARLARFPRPSRFLTLRGDER